MSYSWYVAGVAPRTYAARILAGSMTFDKVPEAYQALVNSHLAMVPVEDWVSAIIKLQGPEARRALLDLCPERIREVVRRAVIVHFEHCKRERELARERARTT